MEITNPVLKLAYENDWYYPWTVPDKVKDSKYYQQAVEEGWSEWVESALDFEAMKNGYIYDVSRDIEDNPCYWIDGHWQLSDGTIIPVDDEADYIGHVGRGDQFMRFCETFLKHTKAPLEGQPYRSIPWMRKAAQTLFGWVSRKTGYRRYNNFYCAIAKKNGKSALMSTIALYMLVADGTPKAQVYSCACDRNQARIIYDEAMHMVKGSNILEDMVTVVESRSRLVHQSSGSFYQVLSADAHRNDGVDSSCTLIDEIHRHPNRKLYSVMLRAGQARAEPLLATITTYGPSLSDGSIWAEIHNEAKAQLEGLRPNSWRNLVMVASAEPISVTTTARVNAGECKVPVSRLIQPVEKQIATFDVVDFGTDGVDNKRQVQVEIVEEAKRFQDYLVIKPLDDELPEFSEATVNLDWRSDHAIYRANPSVGVVFESARLKEQIDASRTPEREAETRQLNLNIVSGSGRKWISTAAWQSCGKMLVQPLKLQGRSCYAGLDLSFKNDLTAFGLAFPNWEPGCSIETVENPRIDLMTWIWVPRANIEMREEDEQFPYSHYERLEYYKNRGPVIFCEGSVIDYAQVASDILDLCSDFGVLAIAYDPNYANFCIPALESGGMTCVQHRQGAVSMSPPCKRFSECVYTGVLAHGNNPILDRAVEGAQLHPPDKAGNTYLAKSSSKTRIDALVAQVMSVGFCCDPPEGASSAYLDGSTGMWG